MYVCMSNLKLSHGQRTGKDMCMMFIVYAWLHYLGWSHNICRLAVTLYVVNDFPAVF